MRLWVVAGALAAAAFPSVAAAERTEVCQEESRSSATAERAEPTMAPAPNATRPVIVQREAQDATRDARRRGGKRIPDAELIGPRGAL